MASWAWRWLSPFAFAIVLAAAVGTAANLLDLGETAVDGLMVAMIALIVLVGTWWVFLRHGRES